MSYDEHSDQQDADGHECPCHCTAAAADIGFATINVSLYLQHITVSSLYTEPPTAEMIAVLRIPDAASY